MMVNGINFEGLLSRDDDNENTWRFPIIILLFLGFLSRGSPRMGGGGREGHREQGGELAWFRLSFNYSNDDLKLDYLDRDHPNYNDDYLDGDDDHHNDDDAVWESNSS